MRPCFIASASLAAACFASSSFASIVTSYSVGTGAFTSTVQVDFENGNGYLFEVSWDQAMNGYQLLAYIDAQLEPVTHSAEQYSFGAFVTGIGVGSDAQFGVGDLWPVENWWHYWTHDAGAWEQSSVGASDRINFDGSFDAWVFGSSAAPQAVPAPGALALLVAMRARRRR